MPPPVTSTVIKEESINNKDVTEDINRLGKQLKTIAKHSFRVQLRSLIWVKKTLNNL